MRLAIFMPEITAALFSLINKLFCQVVAPTNYTNFNGNLLTPTFVVFSLIKPSKPFKNKYQICNHLHNHTQTPTNQLNDLLLQLLDNEAKTWLFEIRFLST